MCGTLSKYCRAGKSGLWLMSWNTGSGVKYFNISYNWPCRRQMQWSVGRICLSEASYRKQLELANENNRFQSVWFGSWRCILNCIRLRSMYRSRARVMNWKPFVNEDLAGVSSECRAMLLTVCALRSKAMFQSTDTVYCFALSIDLINALLCTRAYWFKQGIAKILPIVDLYGVW